MKAATVLALFLAASSAGAAGRFTTSISIEPDGGAAAVLWQSGSPLYAGLSHYRLAETYWTFATAGATVRRGKSTLQGEFNVGPGRSEDDFLYKVARVTIARQVTERQVFVEIEDRYIDVDVQQGNLVRAGLSWLPTKSLLLSVSRHVSTSGNLGTRFTSVRADWDQTRYRWTAGAAAGESAPVLFQQIDGAGRTSVVEAFGGVSSAGGPGRSGRWGFVLHFTQIGGDSRLRGTVSWTFPE